MFVALTILNISGCKDDEVPSAQPDFTYSGNDAPAPCTVTFTNSSVDAVSYLWTFGDLDSSTAANPVHVFQEGGTFSVTLYAYNEENKSQSVTKNIDIGTMPYEARFVKVTINDLPLVTATSVPFDPAETGIDTLPDVIFTVSTVASTYNPDLFPIPPATPDTIQNVGAGGSTLPISWEYPTGAFAINKNDFFTTTFHFYIYDWDTPSSWKSIGNLGPFNLGNYVGDYPTQIDTVLNNISLSFELEWPTN